LKFDPKLQAPPQENAMPGYVTNIETKTLKNKKFREVLFTAKNMQLVLMALRPAEDIGMETHDDVDQFIRIEAGEGTAILNGKKHRLVDGSVVVIPAGTRHNIVNKSKRGWLKLYSIYTPPEHPDKTVHRNKAEAEAYERKHHQR
jgi:mannose-6-phosphate isomerase-like protein (cupin superfamily)